MTLSQVLTSVGQIDVRNVKAHLCEYFCVLAPLGELQSPKSISDPMIFNDLWTGGKTAGCNGEGFDIFVTAFAQLLRM